MDEIIETPTIFQKAWKWLKWPLIVASITLFLLIIYWAFWPFRSWRGTGFVYYDPDIQVFLPRTLWDWLGLLIVPAALAIGAFWFNKTQKETELKIAERERKNESQIAAERQMQATLEAYYDRMTTLLLEYKLRESEPDSEVRSIARARTITVIRSLDGNRIGQLFAFLKASKLNEFENPIIDFIQADFVEANLSFANLSLVNMSGATLILANLREANLREATLMAANLSGANLSQAQMIDSNLFGASLKGTNLRAANLSGANLSQVDMFNAYLEWASLGEANLRAANLSHAYLMRVMLYRANLSEANLSGANLRGANLDGARGWTFDQLSQAETLENATMPDGIVLKSKGPTFDEWKAQYVAQYGSGTKGEQGSG